MILSAGSFSMSSRSGVKRAPKKGNIFSRSMFSKKGLAFENNFFSCLFLILNVYFINFFSFKWSNVLGTDQSKSLT